jgi:metallo-beta-lactamase class B
MNMRILIAVLIVCFAPCCYSQSTGPRINVSRDIEVIRLSAHAYVYVSYADVQHWGRVPSNGLLYISDGEALLFNTPMNDSLTMALVEWITDSLKVTIAGCIGNHWHDDGIGGLRYLKSVGIPSYAHEKTIAIARSKDLPVPEHSFHDSLTLHVGKEFVVCRYFGAAHTVDNIVSWIPAESILFGGCMVKDLTSETLGNIADADLVAWPSTIARVIAAYPAAQIVIPGHGAIGGSELLRHTQVLLKKTK